ncbi:hypothetical protein C8R46DRAFT_1229881 [Mycena filopes]|nr:hypothetical protein C8R46DRAFT_1229881 [Mycena filopes]
MTPSILISHLRASPAQPMGRAFKAPTQTHSWENYLEEHLADDDNNYVFVDLDTWSGTMGRDPFSPPALIAHELLKAAIVHELAAVFRRSLSPEEEQELLVLARALAKSKEMREMEEDENPMSLARL